MLDDFYYLGQLTRGVSVQFEFLKLKKREVKVLFPVTGKSTIYLLIID
jgi:hypothetical protein